MRRAILAVAALLGLLAPAPFFAHAEMVDAVVATVDKDVVLYSRLMAQIGREIDELRKNATSADEFKKQANDLLQDALETEINTLLLAREARKIPQMEVQDKDLDLELDEVRKNYPGTPEEFVKEVGAVSEFREMLRQRILARRMGASKMAALEAEVVVSEEEISTFYNDHIKDFDRPERILLRQIFLRVKDDSERPAAREKLEQIRQEVLAGTSFEDLAKQHSQALGAEVGGLVGNDGWQSRSDQQHDLAEPLESAAFALPAGGVSEVIDSNFGVHLLKVDKHEEAGAKSLNDVRLEIEEVLRQEGAQKKYDVWIDDLRKRSRVRKFL